MAKYSNDVTVPYNFVPLPDKAVPAPISAKSAKGVISSEAYANYLKNKGVNSGYIDIEIETLTPTCIDAEGRFFAPGGKPVIPGSTLRGMVKNYLKMISCGTLRADDNEDMTSRHLYYRDFASSIEELKKLYAKKMTVKKDGKVEYKAEAGILVRLADNSYAIIPATYTAESYEKRKGRDGKPIVHKDKGNKVSYEYIIPSYLTYDKNKNGCIQVNKDSIDCHTGAMKGKGHYYRISNPDWNRRIKVSMELIQDYKDDKNRTGLNLLDEGNGNINISKKDFFKGHKFKHAVPCFYVAKDDKALHFGYGKYYRIPYDKAIEEHIPAGLKKNGIIDFATAMFGSKENFASRVFFEDSIYMGGGELLESSKSHNLMGPKPTSFQLYLEQPGKGLKHWDDDTKLRGYKLYWHQELDKYDWKFDRSRDKDINDTHPIQPISAKAKFRGRIRFEKLSNEELGALLAVIELGKNGCFKIGMGKPLGMGSIKVTGKLALIDQQNRYNSLFSQESWATGVREKVDTVKFIKAFAAYMKQQTENLGIAEDYAEVKNALALMMDWNKKPDSKQLAYMKVGDDRYKKRVVLKTPDKIAKK